MKGREQEAGEAGWEMSVLSSLLGHKNGARVVSRLRSETDVSFLAIWNSGRATSRLSQYGRSQTITEVVVVCGWAEEGQYLAS